MKKNTASQVIGAQVITAADGSAFTGSVTVAVTGDGGTQATGSVGAGACTHEGNGFHTYAPAQAETNYDHVAFTFTGTGAIPVTVQVYTTFPQTGDSYGRIGAPAGASVSADVAAVKAETATIVADTNELQGDWVNGGRLDLILDDVLADTAALPSFPANFAALGINASGHVSRVTLVDTTTTNTDMRGTDSAYTGTPPTAAAISTQVASDLATAHGAGSWATATGFSTLTTGDIPTAAAIATAVLTTAMTEAYRAAGAAPTLAQAQFEIIAHMGDSAISGTTKTLKKIDGTIAKTFTLDDATTPTSITEAT